MNDAMTRISDSLDKNLIGLEFLRDILSQNEERVYIDDKDGELVVKIWIAQRCTKTEESVS